jgi:uncharacterized protein YbjT (DUF2867 family)
VPASISDIRFLLKVKKLSRAADPRRVFVTGGTGYMGSTLVPALIERGHRVRALVRNNSQGKLPAGCEVVSGDALDGKTYRQFIRPCDTFVHLVGVGHPSPAKGAEFRSIDFVAAREAISVAAESGIQHFVYLSVAHPAPTMKAYIAVRSDCEAMIREHALNATILRPWYVLGHGHRWPYVLLPLYKIAELLPSTRPGAQRLGLVTLEQMILSLIQAVETPQNGVRIVEVPEIRASQLATHQEPAVRTA